MRKREVIDALTEVAALRHRRVLNRLWCNTVVALLSPVAADRSDIAVCDLCDVIAETTAASRPLRRSWNVALRDVFDMPVIVVLRASFADTPAAAVLPLRNRS